MGKLLGSKVLQLACVLYALTVGSDAVFGQATLYTEGSGVNPPFEDIREDITNGYPGTIIDVNNELVEGGFFGSLAIEDNLRLHTLASSSLAQSTFGN